MQAQAEQAADKEKTVLIVLTRDYDVELRHRLLGQLLRRVKEFAAKYDTDGIPQVVARAVEWDFAKDKEDQEYFIVVGCQGLEIVGHLLCRSINYFGNRWCYVQQMEIDEGSGITLNQERAAFSAVKAWAKTVGAVGIRAVAPSPVHVRRLRMLHGGKPKHTTMVIGEDSNG